MKKQEKPVISREALDFFDKITEAQKWDIYDALVQRSKILEGMRRYKMPKATIFGDEVFELMIRNLQHANHRVTSSMVKSFDNFNKQQSLGKEIIQKFA